MMHHPLLFVNIIKEKNNLKKGARQKNILEYLGTGKVFYLP